ncbi:MAG TPA: 2-polyprenyl-3-methyl-6-methoxy-1,4-benzoquinone monooxygenase [Burkholderiales bacterium]|jgi:ubiquinone biosynthesis monooxygenase Coq7|nr:2-polyprenyl-3-methyl-6-methoxy-1,4-benzoquinone monooxygenase [Burkholderiales bacterium]
MPDIDRLIIGFDRALRTLCAPAVSLRPAPGENLPNPELSAAEKRHAAALMRVNHSGEVCAQALYQGQALTARDDAARKTLERAAAEETEHLAWTAQRIDELGGRVSVLNPFFFAGAFAIGALSGLLGDKWNMGFLAETERQVEGHLDGHLEQLPARDEKSRAIVAQMKEDEARHANTALAHGAAELPEPVKQAMRISSRLMTVSTYRV